MEILEKIGDTISEKGKEAADKAKEILESFDEEDRQEAKEMIGKYVNKDTISDVTDMISDGLNGETVSEMKEYLKESISEEDQAKLEELYRKYGQNFAE